MAQKVCRVGDGDANASIWRLQLPDFFAMGHVSSHLKCFRLSQVHEAILQVKYSIESIKRTTAEKGGLGAKVATDSTYNCFVNTKGRAYTSSALFLTSCFSGLPHSNIHADIYMEHRNLAAKQRMSAAKGIKLTYHWLHLISSQFR